MTDEVDTATLTREHDMDRWHRWRCPYIVQDRPCNCGGHTPRQKPTLYQRLVAWLATK